MPWRDARRSARRRLTPKLPGSAARWCLRGVVVAVGVIVLAPAAITAVLSFGNDPFVTFPPRTWGLGHYDALAHEAAWGSALRLSVTVGAASAALALAIGVPAVIAMHRGRLPGRHLLENLCLAPLLIPGAAYALAMYSVFATVRLTGSPLALIIAHATLGVPFVILIVGAAITRVPEELELVAMTLGATRRRARIGITGRLLLPACGMAALFAFFTSFDDGVFVNFIGGAAGGLMTLPRIIYESLLTGLDPTITAVATVLMLVTVLVLVGATVVSRRSGERG